MAAVRTTRLFLRRTAAAVTLIGAALPAVAGGWDGVFVLPWSSAAQEPGEQGQDLPGLLLGVAWGAAPGRASGPAAEAPQVRAGFGTSSLQGYLSLPASGRLQDLPGTGRSDFGVGVIFAPSSTFELQGEVLHSDTPDAAAAGGQDRLRLSASFRF